MPSPEPKPKEIVVTYCRTVKIIAAAALAFVAIGAPIGMTVLTIVGHQIPEALSTVGGAAIGALVTMMSTRNGHH